MVGRHLSVRLVHMYMNIQKDLGVSRGAFHGVLPLALMGSAVDVSHIWPCFFFFLDYSVHFCTPRNNATSL